MQSLPMDRLLRSDIRLLLLRMEEAVLCSPQFGKCDRQVGAAQYIVAFAMNAASHSIYKNAQC